MESYVREIANQTVYPILIKNNGNCYLTLYYYTDRSDSVLHSDAKRIIYFQSAEMMEDFCKRNELLLENDFSEYDFDAPIKNPINYTQILNNWNLLNTVSGTFGMFFEGDAPKYTKLYDLLFRLNTSIDSIPSTYDVGDRFLRLILKVFRKKDRFLKLFELYFEN